MPVSPIWLGTATPVAQLDTFTPGSVNVGNIFTLTTASGKTINFTATAATVANVTAGLLAALALTTIPEFQEVTWTDLTTALTGLAATLGKPFTITCTKSVGTGGGAPTFVRTATTANTGPNNWDEALNWSTATVPANGDSVTLDGNVSILYGLAQSAVTLARLDAPASFTGQVGLPRWTGLYYEYRPRYLNVKSTIVNIGAGDGNGSPRFMLDTDIAQTTLSVFKTASSAEPGLPSMLWKGTHAANAVRITRGSFGAAWSPGEVATVADLKIGFVANVQTDAIVTTGSGVTLGTIEKTGGVLTTNGAFTSINQLDGTSNHNGSTANITTVTCDNGTINYNSDGTITDIAGGGAFNFDGSLLACTVTNINLFEGYSFTDSRNRVVKTNGIKLNHCTVTDKLNIGEHIQITGVVSL